MGDEAIDDDPDPVSIEDPSDDEDDVPNLSIDDRNSYIPIIVFFVFLQTHRDT